ncbi:MAG: hypothetical protein DRP75_01145 [Candidatus Omnitrophota bacterium]|nr:MAG: hypothetical protein DRP75_01145 [Candidatus Omnitrophota bacterium]
MTKQGEGIILSKGYQSDALGEGRMRKDSEEEERRAYKRIDFRFPLRYRLLSECDRFPELRKIHSTLARDIGKGGLCLRSERFIPKYAHLLIESAPFSPYWRARAEVRWIQRIGYSERYNIGLKFKEQEKKIEEIVKLYYPE